MSYLLHAPSILNLSTRRWMELTEKCLVLCKQRSALFLAKKTGCGYSRKCSQGRSVCSVKWNGDEAVRVKGCEVARSAPYPKASQ